MSVFNKCPKERLLENDLVFLLFLVTCNNHNNFINVAWLQGANFRDLPGVCVGDDNKVYFDPNMKQVMLPSGKPLVLSDISSYYSH